MKVTGQCGAYPDGQQSIIGVDTYFDDLVAYIPQPSSATFTLLCCGGAISLPTDLSGNWGDLIHIPVHVSNNSAQICDFEFDFVFNPLALDVHDIGWSAAVQDWTTLSWSQVESGKIRITGQAGSGTCLPSSSDSDLVVVKAVVRCVGYAGETLIPIKIEGCSNGIATLCPREFETDFLYKPCPRLGDVNGDGIVTPGDTQTAFEIFLGKRIPTASQLTTADANCGCPCEGREHTAENTCITPGDAQWIFEHSLIKRTLPLCSADYTCPESSASSVPLPWHAPVFEQKLSVFPLPTSGGIGERVMIPIMVSNTGGIKDFSFDVIFPHDILDYVGTLAAPLTQGFDVVQGVEQFPGLIRIEGTSRIRIEACVQGSLCVLVFHVRNRSSGKVSLEVANLNQDLHAAEAKSGVFRVKSSLSQPGSISLGQGHEEAGLLTVPIIVSGGSEVQAFGLEFEFPAENLVFLGVECTRLTESYVSVDGYVIRDGVVRVGGFGTGGLEAEAGRRAHQACLQG